MEKESSLPPFSLSCPFAKSWDLQYLCRGPPSRLIADLPSHTRDTITRYHYVWYVRGNKILTFPKGQSNLACYFSWLSGVNFFAVPKIHSLIKWDPYLAWDIVIRTAIKSFQCPLKHMHLFSVPQHQHVWPVRAAGPHSDGVPPLLHGDLQVKKFQTNPTYRFSI